MSRSGILSLLKIHGVMPTPQPMDVAEILLDRAHPHFYHLDTGELSDIPANQVGIMSLPDLPESTEQESVEALIRVRDRNF